MYLTVSDFSQTSNIPYFRWFCGTDFSLLSTLVEYAHQALYVLDDVEDALQRLQALQYFREEYNINDTPEEGVEIFSRFLEKHPGFVLSIDYEPMFGHFVIVYD